MVSTRDNSGTISPPEPFREWHKVSFRLLPLENKRNIQPLILVPYRLLTSFTSKLHLRECQVQSFSCPHCSVGDTLGKKGSERRLSRDMSGRVWKTLESLLWTQFLCHSYMAHTPYFEVCTYLKVRVSCLYTYSSSPLCTLPHTEQSFQ